MSSPIRIGRVSSIDYEKGKARVTYDDKDSCVTSELPFLATTYDMPEVGDTVVVAHTDGGISGVILGRIYNSKNSPDGKKGLYKLEMSKEKGKAVISYDEDAESIKIVAPEVEIIRTKVTRS